MFSPSSSASSPLAKGTSPSPLPQERQQEAEGDQRVSAATLPSFRSFQITLTCLTKDFFREGIRSEYVGTVSAKGTPYSYSRVLSLPTFPHPKGILILLVNPLLPREKPSCAKLFHDIRGVVNTSVSEEKGVAHEPAISQHLLAFSEAHKESSPSLTTLFICDKDLYYWILGDQTMVLGNLTQDTQGLVGYTGTISPPPPSPSVSSGSVSMGKNPALTSSSTLRPFLLLGSGMPEGDYKSMSKILREYQAYRADAPNCNQPFSKWWLSQALMQDPLGKKDMLVHTLYFPPQTQLTFKGAAPDYSAPAQRPPSPSRTLSEESAQECEVGEAPPLSPTETQTPPPSMSRRSSLEAPPSPSTLPVEEDLPFGRTISTFSYTSTCSVSSSGNKGSFYSEVSACTIASIEAHFVSTLPSFPDPRSTRDAVAADSRGEEVSPSEMELPSAAAPAGSFAGIGPLPRVVEFFNTHCPDLPPSRLPQQGGSRPIQPPRTPIEVEIPSPLRQGGSPLSSATSPSRRSATLVPPPPLPVPLSATRLTLVPPTAAAVSSPSGTRSSASPQARGWPTPPTPWQAQPLPPSFPPQEEKKGRIISIPSPSASHQRRSKRKKEAHPTDHFSFPKRPV